VPNASDAARKHRTAGAVNCPCGSPPAAGSHYEDGCSLVAPAPTRGGQCQSAVPDLEGVAMTVLHSVTDDALDPAEPLSIDGAYARSHQAALAESALGVVGLEIESHLVDLDSVADPVQWDRVSPVLGIVGEAAGRCAVSLEPGGQLELSGPPAPGILSTVTELRSDWERTRRAMHGLRLGLALAGADPLRPPRRVNPRSRYRAMEGHFTATGRAGPGAVMTNSTRRSRSTCKPARDVAGLSEWPARTGSVRLWWRSRQARRGCADATPAGSRRVSGRGAAWTRACAARCPAASRPAQRSMPRSTRPGRATPCAPRCPSSGCAGTM